MASHPRTRVLLGRSTYDDWAGFWPGSAIEPFASFINKVQKSVVTSTPLGQEWAPTTAVHGGLTEFVTELKHQPGADIGIHGSLSVTQSLLGANLVDELRLIAPAVQVHGRRLFEAAAALASAVAPMPEAGPTTSTTPLSVWRAGPERSTRRATYRVLSAGEARTLSDFAKVFRGSGSAAIGGQGDAAFSTRLP